MTIKRERLLDWIRNGDAKEMPVLFGFGGREPYLPSYMEAIRKVARGKYLPLIDHSKYWKKYEKSVFFLMSDAFHPNNIGHRVFAKLIFQSLNIWDTENSYTCKFFIS
ncbi:MAG: SGNH/GDSL hydrolase family protein [Victivallaceae bacterium]|nr:SGNH/GDSL hydrolase family protein [Victivallaceae bacterium]